eukprot:TRINITY_DN12159_c0_g1_i1.p4 TRINITY_DN12159_c0_g1~~TRINITY_DN12159_c0_g1_i1.p4  ORF type:complete len:76 (-),score=0.20 TRINITY_DN12159_c0_g1_i1:122-349(-)
MPAASSRRYSSQRKWAIRCLVDRRPIQVIQAIWTAPSITVESQKRRPRWGLCSVARRIESYEVNPTSQELIAATP